MKQLAAAAMTLTLLSPVLAAEPDLQVSRTGTREMRAVPAQNFTGSASVEMLYAPAAPDGASVGTVRFSPGARLPGTRIRSVRHWL